MSRAPVPMPPEAWRYAAAYVLSGVLGLIAFGWGVWLSMPFVQASATNLPVIVHDGKTTFGIVVAAVGLSQSLFCGVVARGFWLPPFVLSLLWGVWATALVYGNWHTPGPAVYGLLSLCQAGVVLVVNFDWLREAAAVARQTVAELRRG